MWVPLEFLLDPDNREDMVWEYKGMEIPMQCYRYQGRLIWGLSLMMLDELDGFDRRKQQAAQLAAGLTAQLTHAATFSWGKYLYLWIARFNHGKRAVGLQAIKSNSNPALLRQVHGLISFLFQLLLLTAINRKHGYANTGAEGQQMLAHRDRLLNGLRQLMRNSRSPPQLT